MKKLFCDFDDVICDNKIIDLMNEFLGTNYTFDDIGEGYDASNVVADDNRLRKMYEYVIEKNFYNGATLKKDAYEVLKNLQDNYGYEIYICSACVVVGYEYLSSKVYFDKFNFIYETMPFIKPKNLVFTNAKGVVSGDVMIDDRLVNLNGDFKTKLLFDCHYNRKYTDAELKDMGVTRVRTWKEIESILTKI